MSVLLVATAVASAASLLLHAFAARTKNTYDDKLEEFFDEVVSLLHSNQPLVETKSAELAPAK